MRFDREGSLSCQSFCDLGLSHPKTFTLTRIARQSRDTEALFTGSNDDRGKKNDAVHFSNYFKQLV